MIGFQFFESNYNYGERKLGTSIYDVRSGWGEGVPKKQTKGTKFVTGGRGSKKSEKFADVIYGSPQRALGDLGMRQDEDMSELTEE